MGITVSEGDNKLHKIIEAGTNCGRDKDPGSAGMMLSYDNNNCDNTEEEEEDTDEERRSVNTRRVVCSSDVSNELTEDTSDSAHLTIVSQTDSDDDDAETETVDQILTQISGSETHYYCQYTEVRTMIAVILLTVFMIQ